MGVLFVISCTKTETPSTPAPTVVKEESISFTTNIDTGAYYVSDTLPLIISVTSKLPTSGVMISVISTWTDSSKQINKIDTTLLQSSANINIPGLKKEGTYSIAITVTSKSTLSNTSSKNVTAINSAIRNFTGYRVDQVALNLSKQRDFGRSYWRSQSYNGDLVITAFQKNHISNMSIIQRTSYQGGYQAISAGDFNNDGYIDFFNAGGTYNKNGNASAFLIWDVNKKVFVETTLFNDKKIDFGGNKNTCIPVYLNEDNYIDMVIFDNGDEGVQNSPNEPIRIVLSDGKGGYDLKDIETNENYTTSWGGMSKFYYGNKKESGDVGDLNMDGIPDLLIVCNSQTYIYWGIKSFPFFSQTNHAQIFSDVTNFGYLSDNGFGEQAPKCSNFAFYAHIFDLNKDGKNDIVLGSAEDPNNSLFFTKQRVLYNLGKGRFNNTSVLELPLYQKVLNGLPINVDFLCDDINKDGLNDIITINYTSGNQGFGIYWDFFIYLQNQDGTFKIDNSSVQFTTNTNRNINGEYRRYIAYHDLNSDGQKDIILTESVNNNKSSSKTVFIRKGNQFVEQDYFQFDPYGKSLLSLIK